MNGAQWVVHALRAQGVNTVFGYPGGAIMPVYDALYDGGVEHLLCRHEQGAAMAAIGYARATGKTGVCIATSGPGATNLITGLADALLDSIPCRCHHRSSVRTFYRHRRISGSGCPGIVVSLYQAQLSGAVAGRVAAHHGCSIRRCQLRSSWSGSGRYPKRYPASQR